LTATIHLRGRLNQAAGKAAGEAATLGAQLPDMAADAAAAQKSSARQETIRQMTDGYRALAALNATQQQVTESAKQAAESGLQAGRETVQVLKTIDANQRNLMAEMRQMAGQLKNLR
jgi:hypothetical protein